MMMMASTTTTTTAAAAAAANTTTTCATLSNAKVIQCQMCTDTMRKAVTECSHTFFWNGYYSCMWQ
jgi:predicted nucleic acid-binding Zn ribbon protein